MSNPVTDNLSGLGLDNVAALCNASTTAEQERAAVSSMNRSARIAGAYGQSIQSNTLAVVAECNGVKAKVNRLRLNHMVSNEQHRAFMLTAAEEERNRSYKEWHEAKELRHAYELNKLKHTPASSLNVAAPFTPAPILAPVPTAELPVVVDLTGNAPVVDLTGNDTTYFVAMHPKDLPGTPAPTPAAANKPIDLTGDDFYLRAAAAVDESENGAFFEFKEYDKNKGIHKTAKVSPRGAPLPRRG